MYRGKGPKCLSFVFCVVYSRVVCRVVHSEGEVGWVVGLGSCCMLLRWMELAYMASIVHRIELSKEDRILSAEKLSIAPLLFKRSFYCEISNHVKCKSEGFGGRG